MNIAIDNAALMPQINNTRILSESEFYRHDIYPMLIARLTMMGITLTQWKISTICAGLTQYCKKDFVEAIFINQYDDLKNIRLNIRFVANNNIWTIKNIDIYDVMDPAIM